MDSRDRSRSPRRTKPGEVWVLSEDLYGPRAKIPVDVLSNYILAVATRKQRKNHPHREDFSPMHMKEYHDGTGINRAFQHYSTLVDSFRSMRYVPEHGDVLPIIES